MGSFRCRRAALAALGALVLLPSGALAAPTLSEYTAGLTPNAGPTGVTAGPDGAVWFTETSNNDVGRIAPDGSITEFHGLTRQSPTGITAGPDGNLWITEEASGPGAIARMTPAGAVSEYVAGLSYGPPQEIAAGADGNLWFTENGGTGAVGRITPSGTIAEYTAGLTPNSSPHGITAGPDGNVWFVEKLNPGRIGRITPSGAITEFGDLPAGLPHDIVAGPDGNLWFTAGAAPGYIGRITPSGEVTAFSSGLTANAYPQDIAVGRDGALYFTEKAGSAIGRITTAGQIDEYATPTSSSSPMGIAAGPDGNIWFAENASPGALGRVTVDPAPPALPALPAAVAPVQPAALAPAPSPVLGRTVVVDASSGVIRVRRPGQRTFQVVRDAMLQPTGTEIDARRGTALLTTALGGGRVQRASFRGTYFKVRQSARRRGLTDIVLTAGRVGGARAASVTRRKPPSLWAHDSHGRYRTFGRNSVASVRGTTWRTTERRDGTLTQVTAGAVSVRDLHRRRTVLVRAGRRYLARG